MPRNKKAPFDPVILIMLGIVFVAVAIGLAAIQGNSGSSVSIASDSAAISQLFVAFVTGLTTGGLSCLAVQGGLLAGTLAHQIEEDYTQQAVQEKSNKKNKAQAPVHSNAAQPILLFLGAKIVAYTLLGALLSLLGSYLSLSPATRGHSDGHAVVQIESRHTRSNSRVR